MFGVLRAGKLKARRFNVESPARLSDVRLLPLAVIQPQSVPPPASDPAADKRVGRRRLAEGNVHVSLSSPAVLLQNVKRRVREQ